MLEVYFLLCILYSLEKKLLASQQAADPLSKK
jgi:hypothetical protein